jgi:prevent-host-death family protein
MSLEVGVRELRNHTTNVIDAVERGETVHLTRHGRRIATIVPARPEPSEEVADFLRLLDGRAPYDSGLAEFVREQRALDVEPDRWA